MVSQTSLLAYKQVTKDLGERQQQVYDALESMGSASNEQIAEKLNIPINYVTGRVSELRRLGFIGVEGLTKNKSGMTAKLWSLRDPFSDKKLKEIDCEG